MQCSTCQKNLREGINCFRVEEGVFGTGGFVDLEEGLYFCSDECLRQSFSASGGYEKAPRRIP